MAPRDSWKTPKGTVLPILNLRGKEYLQVPQRIVWFREDHPHGCIDTICVSMTDAMAHFKATISIPNPKGDGYIKLADADKIEHKKDFGDYAEKAQTAAIGRALALCGYGTQFCADELDEKERLADSPVIPTCNPGEANSNALPADATPNVSHREEHHNPGDFLITFGKYKNKSLKEVGIDELFNYVDYLENKSEADQKPIDPNGFVRKFINAVFDYEQWREWRIPHDSNQKA